MRQKKVAFGIIGLLTLAVLYYFITQLIQVNKQVDQLHPFKQQLNVQLTEIQANGFSLSNRATGEEKEHFFIRLDEPEKASAYLTQKGIQVTVEEAKEIMGLTLAVDLSYQSESIAFELYPITLPTELHTLLALENDKQLLVQFQEMLRKKTFFAHIEVDHNGSTFKGYLRDINTTLKGTKEAKLLLQGFHFSGTVKQKIIVNLAQTLRAMHLYIEGEIDRSLYGVQHHYTRTGPTMYDYIEEYRIQKVTMDEAPEATLLAEGLFTQNTSSVANGLASETLKTQITNIALLFEKETLGLTNFFLDMNIGNIDIRTFETLQKSGPNNNKAVDRRTTELLSPPVHIDIPRLSADKITLQGNEIDGFSLHATIKIDNSLDLSRFHRDPRHALSKMDAKMELSLSKELLDLIKEEPEAMLLTMMYSPKSVSDQRIYTIDLKDGVMKINGKALKINGEVIKF